MFQLLQNIASGIVSLEMNDDDEAAGMPLDGAAPGQSPAHLESPADDNNKDEIQDDKQALPAQDIPAEENSLFGFVYQLLNGHDPESPGPYVPLEHDTTAEPDDLDSILHHTGPDPADKDVVNNDEQDTESLNESEAKRRENMPLAQHIADWLKPELPPLVRAAGSVSLLYSLESHGTSLKTLYRSSSAEPLLLIIVTETRIFGAFSNVSFTPTTHFIGNGSCMLFDYTNKRVFRSTGKNEYYVLCQPDSLAFGGTQGRFGLLLDESLCTGSSSETDTFGNPGFETCFDVVDVQVWTWQYN